MFERKVRSIELSKHFDIMIEKSVDARKPIFREFRYFNRFVTHDWRDVIFLMEYIHMFVRGKMHIGHTYRCMDFSMRFELAEKIPTLTLTYGLNHMTFDRAEAAALVHICNRVLSRIVLFEDEID